jgi:hypothetical protein
MARQAATLISLLLLGCSSLDVSPDCANKPTGNPARPAFAGARPGTWGRDPLAAPQQYAAAFPTGQPVPPPTAVAAAPPPPAIPPAEPTPPPVPPPPSVTAAASPPPAAQPMPDLPRPPVVPPPVPPTGQVLAVPPPPALTPAAPPPEPPTVVEQSPVPPPPRLTPPEHTVGRPPSLNGGLVSPQPIIPAAASIPQPAPALSGVPQPPAGPREPPPGGPAVRLVNSKRICLNYAIKDVGPSGVASVELWYTRDGKTWKKHDHGPQRQPPYVVDVSEDGLYGFTLVARSGNGLGKAPPKTGDAPQVWVEVDMTRPEVRLLATESSYTGKTPSLNIRWSASDKNLAARPITLSYAEKSDGPWTPIAAKLENTGNYTWELGPDGPHRFVVRVEAVDRAGNAATAQSPSPVEIDLSQPAVSILTVEPGK